MTSVLKTQRPEVVVESGLTLGALLCQRRRQFSHRRIDAASIIGADPKSLMWWERDVREPLDRFWPAIIRYLDCEPWPEPRTLGDQLRAERRRRGLAIFEAAKVLGVDETTFWWWETGRREPQHARTKALVASFVRAGDRF